MILRLRKIFKYVRTKTLLAITIKSICVVYILYLIIPLIIRSLVRSKQYTPFIKDDKQGWISHSLYDEFRSYITSREHTIGRIPKRLRMKKKNITILPLDYNYIQHIKNTTSIVHPYSTWKCSKTSNKDYMNAGEYCILTNIYYNSQIDQYYFYEDSSKNTTNPARNAFIAPHSDIKFNIIDDIMLLNRPVAAILTQPILVSTPPDFNYAHGFLELCGPRFWVLAECQYHASYVNPSTIQIYYTSHMFNGHAAYWELYQQQSDKTFKPRRQWEQIIQAMFSIYPLLIYPSFNSTTVLFKYMIFPGKLYSRTACWGYTYPLRKYHSYPMTTEHYRRAYLAYSEWILYHLNLKSKFELTAIQKKLQENNQSERVPICNQTCDDSLQSSMSIDDYTGEWIVVLNRANSPNRVITNAKYLVQALLKVFPDHSNPYLRVWPKELDFNDNFYESVRIARSIRLLIGVHGAGLSNAAFMRPGAILYEINPYGCEILSFNFRRWAEVFNLQHALYVPSSGEHGQHDDACIRNGPVTVNIQEIIDEVKNLLRNEMEYRNGYLKRALNVMNDTSIIDYPPEGYEAILS